MLSVLIAVCMLRPAQLEHVLASVSYRSDFVSEAYRGGDLFQEHGSTVFQLELF